jgi:outer membrane protein assembly factor BamD
MLGWRNILVLALLTGLLTSCGFRRKKYENPITKDTQQPDKVLYDKAVQDIERSRFEVARITLNTLINTYDTSEFMAKAKLAIADSWFREGGSHGLAQAEAEYKDFILFYPTLEEAAEAQEKVCMIHVKQMEKTDRDVKHAVRAEDECRQLLVQFPNSKFAPRAQQLLREIQEVIADSEYRVGAFYHTKGSNPAAANRLQALVDQYPLYSQADDALWRLGDAYSKMGPRFRDASGAAYARIVKEYPLSPLADQARKQLVSMELAVPEADPVAYARMRYELENRTKPGMMSHMWGVFRKSPDVSAAAKSGQPPMTSLRPAIPASVPPPPSGAGVSADVTVSTVPDNTSALDTQPDARLNPPKPEGAKAEAQPEPLPANRQLTPKQKKQIEKQSKKISQK